MALGCATASQDWVDRHPELAVGERPAVVEREASEPRAAEAPAGDAAGSTTLANLIEALLAGSPRLGAARAGAQAAHAAVPSASALPPLMVEYTWLPQPVETRTGPNEHRIGVKQAVPWPGKLIARDAAARARAGSATARYAGALRDEVTRLKVAYADLYYFGQAVGVVAEHESIARALVQLGAERQARDVGTLIDVVRAESQLAQLAYDGVTLRERLETTASTINGLLGRPADHPLPPPADLPKISPPPSRDEALSLAYDSRPELEAADADVAEARAGLSEARAGWLPDLSVGAMIMLQGDSPMTPPPADSGDEAVAVTFGLALPVWLQDNVARVRAADHRLAAALAKKKAALDELAAHIDEALFAWRNADRLVTLYDTQLLPQARAALGDAEQWQRDDPSRYSDVLEARATGFSFALARARAAADRFAAQARLEGLVGRPLPAGGSP